MSKPRPRLAPTWLLTYAGVIVLLGGLVNLAASFAQFAHTLTLPSMQESLRISYTLAGALLTGVWVVRMFSSFVAGTLAPRYGSRVIIGCATLGAGGTMLLLAAASNYLVALLAMMLLGLASGAAIVPTMALFTPWFGAERRGAAAGLAAGGGSIAFVAAGLLVPWLVARDPADGWRQAWQLFGVLALAVGALALLFLRDRPAQPSGAGRMPAMRRRAGGWPMAAYRHPLVWLVSGLAFCSGWSQGVFSAFFGAYLEEEGAGLGLAGQLLIMVGALSVGSGVVWGRLSDWLGRGWGFALSFLAQGAAFGLFWLWPALPSFVIGAALLGVTLRGAYTICAAAAGDYTPPVFSPAAFALMSVGASLGNALSPILAGALADATGTLSWAFAQALAGSVLGMAGGLWLRRREKTRPGGPPARS